jgi:uncharacterized membrane protein
LDVEAASVLYNALITVICIADRAGQMLGTRAVRFLGIFCAGICRVVVLVKTAVLLNRENILRFKKGSVGFRVAFVERLFG